MGIDTEYPEYNSIKVNVKTVRFLANEDLEETVVVSVYSCDEEEIRKAIWEQHNYGLGEFDILEYSCD